MALNDQAKVWMGLSCHAHIAHQCEKCPYNEQRKRFYSGLGGPCDSFLIDDVLTIMEAQKWQGADKRPPREGRYLVYGTTEYVPDHVDEPNAYWEIKISYWSNRYGWKPVRVKYWRELPELPDELQHAEMQDDRHKLKIGSKEG